SALPHDKSSVPRHRGVDPYLEILVVDRASRDEWFIHCAYVGAVEFVECYVQADLVSSGRVDYGLSGLLTPAFPTALGLPSSRWPRGEWQTAQPHEARQHQREQGARRPADSPEVVDAVG